MPHFFFLGKNWSGCRQKGQNPHLFSCFCFVCFFVFVWGFFFFCIYTGEQWVLICNHTGTWSQIRPGENCVPPREINLWSVALPLDKQSWQTALFLIFHNALKMVMQRLASRRAQTISHSIFPSISRAGQKNHFFNFWESWLNSLERLRFTASITVTARGLTKDSECLIRRSQWETNMRKSNRILVIWK